MKKPKTLTLAQKLAFRSPFVRPMNTARVVPQRARMGLRAPK
jgi:hypothetical protein